MGEWRGQSGHSEGIGSKPGGLGRLEGVLPNPVTGTARCPRRAASVRRCPKPARLDDLRRPHKTSKTPLSNTAPFL